VANIETARLLLAAGSETDGPIENLLDVACTTVVWSGDLSELSTFSNQYLLISELFELLLTHLTKSIVGDNYLYFLCAASLVACQLTVPEVISAGCIDYCNSVMDSCANIARCLFFADKGDVEVPDVLTYNCSRYQPIVTMNLLSVLGNLALYASLLGRSSKLIRFLLYNLDSNHIIRLRIYYPQLPAMKTGTHSSLETALFASKMFMKNLLDKQEIHARLEHLACRTIAVAMSGKSLRNASRLGLPTHVQKRLLLGID